MFLLVSVDNDSNYGTEKQEGDVYHNGNSEPKGFGKLSFLCTVYFVFYFYLFVCGIVLSDQNFSCGKCGLPSLGREPAATVTLPNVWCMLDVFSVSIIH